jgi:hypothetical protein
MSSLHKKHPVSSPKESITPSSREYLSPQENTSSKSRQTDINSTKKFLTNSDKSVFNLRWKVRGVMQENYQRSRSRSQSQIDKVQEKSTPRKHPRKHHHHQQPTEFDDEPMVIPTSAKTTPATKHETRPATKHEIRPATKDEATPTPVVYYYPYAYPPMPVHEQPVQQQPMKMRRTNRTTATTTVVTKKPGIKQSDKSLNLVRSNNKLKIEHHYVDSPREAERLINELRRKGFVETGIKASAI